MPGNAHSQSFWNTLLNSLDEARRRRPLGEEDEEDEENEDDEADGMDAMVEENDVGGETAGSLVFPVLFEAGLLKRYWACRSLRLDSLTIWSRP